MDLLYPLPVGVIHFCSIVCVWMIHLFLYKYNIYYLFYIIDIIELNIFQKL